MNGVSPDQNLPTAAGPAEVSGSHLKAEDSLCQKQTEREQRRATHGLDAIIVFLVPLMLAVAFFLKACFPLESCNDVWWHLKTGKFLLEYWDQHGFGFPENDVFSVSGETLPWANHEWLADVLIFLGYDQFGAMGVVALKALTITLTYLLLYWLLLRVIRPSDPAKTETTSPATHSALAGVGCILAFMTSQYTMYLRPPVLTYLFLVIQLHLMWNLRTGQQPISKRLSFWAMPVMMVPWVNLHGGAILGIVLPGLYAMGIALDGIWNRVRESRPLPFSEFGSWALLTGLMFLASLCNPFGYDILMLTAKIMRSPRLIQLISELQSPNFHFTRDYEVLIVLLIGLGVLGRR
ncbi:MAG TPA: hypothetical protein PKH07_10985, partial [bacterium]|nr:hypothetical protein [bacterium]